MKQDERCISCGKGLVTQGSTTFPCPNCGVTIGRCVSCREQSVKYICKKCEFTGP